MRILMISGSTRTASTNTAALRTMRALDVDGIETVLFEHLSDLPQFNPDDDGDVLPLAVAGLRAQIESADAVLFSTPEYAGSLPGSFKNLLDWTVKGGQLYEKPVAWINVANPGRGEGAHSVLRTVLGYVGAVVIEAACVRIPVNRESIRSDGFIDDDAVRDELRRELITMMTATQQQP